MSGRPPVDGFVHPDFIPVAQTLRGLRVQRHAPRDVCDNARSAPSLTMTDVEPYST